MLRIWPTILIITYMLHIRAHQLDKSPDHDIIDWRYIETLAEEHPYTVALLNKHKDIHCAGTIVSPNTVMTSGTCASRDPSYVAVGVAVFRHKAINEHSLFYVARSIVPSVYNFRIHHTQVNQTVIENNIGLVITMKALLDTMFDFVDISNLYASELANKIVGSIGYTAVHELHVSVLSKEWYHESMCLNLKWYYCMCGYEITTTSALSRYRLGEGGPVVLADDTVVVGLTTFPSGRLLKPQSNLKFNVFTITAPYKKWIKSHQEPTHIVHDLMKTKMSTGSSTRNLLYFKNLFTLLLASKVLT